MPRVSDQIHIQVNSSVAFGLIRFLALGLGSVEARTVHATTKLKFARSCALIRVLIMSVLNVPNLGTILSNQISSDKQRHALPWWCFCFCFFFKFPQESKKFLSLCFQASRKAAAISQMDCQTSPYKWPVISLFATLGIFDIFNACFAN